MLFVVGYPRSGTTLISELLSRHPEISISPETHFFDTYFPGGKRLESNRQYHNFLNSQHFKSLKIDTGQWVDFDNVMKKNPASFFHEMIINYNVQNQIEKRILGEKTPAHLLSVPVILKNFKQSKIVCIIRDPRDVLSSHKRLGWNPKSLTVTAFKWKYYASMSFRCLRQYPDNFLLVRYEDLVNHSKNCLNNICKWIGVAFSDNIFSENSPSTYDPKVEPWKVNSAKQIMPHQSGKWKDELTESDILLIEALTKREMDILKYEIYGKSDLLRTTRSIIVDLCKYAFYSRGNLIRKITG